MTHGDILWKDGDAWRDLTDEVSAAGAATAISLHGTARFIDVEHGRQARFSDLSAHDMDCDGEWLPLGDWSLSPCGFVTEAPDHWSRGTPLRLVLAGFVEDWAGTPIGTETLAAVQAGTEPAAPGHPAGPCDAYWCPLGPAVKWRAGVIAGAIRLN